MTAIAARRHRGRAGLMLRSAARGAGLIAAAIVVGIVLLQVVDQGSPSPGGGGTTPTVPSDTTATTGTSATTVGGSTATTKPGSTTTTKAGSGRAAANVHVYVQNASSVNGAAGTKANELRGLGYAIAGTGNSSTQQTGTTVACKSGFEKEQATLIGRMTGSPKAGTFPNPIPTGAESADCIVTVGK